MSPLSPIAARRATILTFFAQHGFAATRDAYRVSRATLFSWRRRLRMGGPTALEPMSRRPRLVRTPTTPTATVACVAALRRAFPGMGKDKLAVLCRERGVRVSASTVGRILARTPGLPAAPRAYTARRRRWRIPKERLPGTFQATTPGALVSMDTVVVQRDGVRKYVVTALDHATRLAVARTYTHPSSRSATDLLQRVAVALGRMPTAVLTDNGSEFHALYRQTCATAGIQHYWTYPRSPKMNARTERFNRTLQEEATLPPVQAPLAVWNAAVGHFCMVYNFFRPHAALAYRRPAEVYLSASVARWPQSKMLWTHTAD